MPRRSLAQSNLSSRQDRFSSSFLLSSFFVSGVAGGRRRFCSLRHVPKLAGLVNSTSFSSRVCRYSIRETNKWWNTCAYIQKRVASVPVEKSW